MPFNFQKMKILEKSEKENRFLFPFMLHLCLSLFTALLCFCMLPIFHFSSPFSNTHNGNNNNTQWKERKMKWKYEKCVKTSSYIERILSFPCAVHSTKWTCYCYVFMLALEYTDKWKKKDLFFVCYSTIFFIKISTLRHIMIRSLCIQNSTWKHHYLSDVRVKKLCSFLMFQCNFCWTTTEVHSGFRKFDRVLCNFKIFQWK